jgi:LysM repeat protein
MLVVLAAHLVGFGVVLTQGCHREAAKPATALAESAIRLVEPSPDSSQQIAIGISETTASPESLETGPATIQNDLRGSRNNAAVVQEERNPETDKQGGTLHPKEIAKSSEASPDDSQQGAVSAEFTLYVVKPGDTLTRIAKAHQTTVGAVRSANDLASDRLKIGQRLRIPTRT